MKFLVIFSLFFISAANCFAYGTNITTVRDLISCTSKFAEMVTITAPLTWNSAVSMNSKGIIYGEFGRSKMGESGKITINVADQSPVQCELDRGLDGKCFTHGPSGFLRATFSTTKGAVTNEWSLFLASEESDTIMCNVYF